MEAGRRRVLLGVGGMVALTGCLYDETDVEDEVIDVEPEVILPAIEDVNNGADWEVLDEDDAWDIGGFDDNYKNRVYRTYINSERGYSVSLIVSVYEDLEAAEEAYEESKPYSSVEDYDGGTEGYINPLYSDTRGIVVYRGGNVNVIVFASTHSTRSTDEPKENIAEDFADETAELLAAEQDRGLFKLPFP